MQGVTHDKIELRAYELWEQDGRPFGRSEEFWFRASTELSVNGTAVKKSKKASAPKAQAATTTKSKVVAEPVAKPKKTAATKAAAKKKN
jgi:hypothetical protein